MTGAVFVAMTLFAMLAVSVRMLARAPAGAMLPMQWGVNLKPTWRAPRLVAGLFAPCVALLVLGLLASSAKSGDSLASVVLVTVGLFFIAVHAIHLHFAVRDVTGAGMERRT